jgi:transcriptional regulator with XRE-family HTH domain
MKESALNLNQKIARRVRQLRLTHNLSLENMAEKSGVSRSMLSLIERGESSPTAVVLDKIAAALGVALATLFEELEETVQSASEPLARHATQPVWQDPASGYLRRNVSPSGLHLPLQIVEVLFPPRKRVTFETSLRAAPLDEQVWVLEGIMQITLGNKTYRLQQGDCLAIHLDCPITYYNPTNKTARYAVVIANMTPAINSLSSRTHMGAGKSRKTRYENNQR